MMVSRGATKPPPIPPRTEVKPTEPKAFAMPAFDINAFNINTAQGVKAAAAELISVLWRSPAGTLGRRVSQLKRRHGGGGHADARWRWISRR
jgi:hypothetical protein